MPGTMDQMEPFLFPTILKPRIFAFSNSIKPIHPVTLFRRTYVLLFFWKCSVDSDSVFSYLNL